MSINRSNQDGFKWAFPAKIVKVVDGDTVDLVLDTGLHTTRTERCRLLGVNAPEMKGNSRLEGEASRLWVVQWFQDAAAFQSTPDQIEWPLLVETLKDPDVFGRYLVTIYRKADGSNLNYQIVESGFAKLR